MLVVNCSEDGTHGLMGVEGFGQDLTKKKNGYD